MKEIKVCCKCGATSEYKRIITSGGQCYCGRCYQRRNNKTYPLPPKGEIVLNEKGNPICHICGEAHRKLMSHVWQIHGMSAYEYKVEFGLDRHEGIMSEESAKIARQRALEHMDINEKNLLVGGASYRFSKGFEGRTRDKVSLQTMNRLKQASFIKKGDVE